ncbi:carbohydrate esterase family 8 protein [Cadophora sp. MPI-SDFR-AT-0126]|nr:carbohydrate esterase family 8 protein [Leotiomycetes sp. MPI-SDFR-AT-0126]
MYSFKSLLTTLVILVSVSSALALPAELDTRATSRSTPPTGCLVVRGSGTKTGEYASLTSAVAAIPSSTAVKCIFIYSGTYTDSVTIRNKGPLTIYGQTTDIGTYKSNTVTITHSLTSAAAGSLDASSTVNIANDDVNVYNINFANSYGSGAQAVAMTANANRLGFYGCQFKSYQDTLYAKSGYQYYSNCYVEGAVDYIFGDATAWFGECTIASSGAGYVTANSRETTTDTAMYVFDHSTVTAASGASVVGKVYLGRPWRVLAKTMYQYSVLTNVVNPAGYAPMADGATPIFMEFQNTGAGSSTSARLYYTPSTAAVTKSALWPLGYSWIDTSY